MEKYVIYCDESERNGKIFSDFFGGIIVEGHNILEIEKAFANLRKDLSFYREFSFKSIGKQDLNAYNAFVNLIFYYVSNGFLKIRIKFRHNMHIPSIIHEDRHLRYCKLYYQLIKHHFALQYSEYSNKHYNVAIYPDTMPESQTKIIEFKKLCVQAVQNMGFKCNIDLIQEKRSHEHILLQAIDVIMGGIQFRLNDKHKEIPDGKKRRGKKTIIKEQIYENIRDNICKLLPENYKNFNIGKSTALYITGEKSDRFTMPYRHWQFIPKQHTTKK